MKKLKLGIVGSRTITDYGILYNYGIGSLMMVNFHPHDISDIISGGAIGVDKLAEKYAKHIGIEPEIHKPDYKRFPPNIAPLMRNHVIARKCDAALVLWDGFSGGTWNTMRKLKELDKPFILVNVIVVPQTARKPIYQVARSIEFHGDWKRLYEDKVHPERNSRKPSTTRQAASNGPRRR